MHAPASGPQELGAQHDSGSCLGLIPHQIRGFLASFNNMLVVGDAYDRCTACSATVVEDYKKRGHEMLLQAFNEDKFLERLTGLDKMYAETEDLAADIELEWDEDEED